MQRLVGDGDDIDFRSGQRGDIAAGDGQRLHRLVRVGRIVERHLEAGESGAILDVDAPLIGASVVGGRVHLHALRQAGELVVKLADLFFGGRSMIMAVRAGCGAVASSARRVTRAAQSDGLPGRIFVACRTVVEDRFVGGEAARHDRDADPRSSRQAVRLRV